MSSPYEEFSERLQHTLDRADFAPGRGRTGALAERYAVSRETVRKWLTGLALPELTRMIELARDFDVSFEWLATGRGQPRLRVGDTAADYNHLTRNQERLLAAFDKLSEPQRKALLQLLSKG